MTRLVPILLVAALTAGGAAHAQAPAPAAPAVSGADFLTRNAKVAGVVSLPSGLQYKVVQSGPSPVGMSAGLASANSASASSAWTPSLLRVSVCTALAFGAVADLPSPQAKLAVVKTRNSSEVGHLLMRLGCRGGCEMSSGRRGPLATVRSYGTRPVDFDGGALALLGPGMPGSLSCG